VQYLVLGGRHETIFILGTVNATVFGMDGSTGNDMRSTTAHNEGTPSTQHPTSLRATQALGGVSLAWLVISTLLVVYGVYLVSGERITNRSVLTAVSLAGAGGAAMGATTSLTALLARSQYKASWTPYFFLRPFFGALLALLVYVLLRGIYLNPSAPPVVMNLYGILAVSFLIGLFSKQALERLSDIADVLFSPANGARRAHRNGGVKGLELSATLLDRYVGRVDHEVTESAPGTWLITVRMSSTPNDMDAADVSNLIDIGEGALQPRVSFDFIMLSHNGVSASPTRGSIQSGPAISSSPLAFELVGVEGSPQAVIEVSHRGRTVGAIEVGETNE